MEDYLDQALGRACLVARTPSPPVPGRLWAGEFRTVDMSKGQHTFASNHGYRGPEL